jgi:hypothetical protein
VGEHDAAALGHNLDLKHIWFNCIGDNGGEGSPGHCIGECARDDSDASYRLSPYVGLLLDGS